MVQARSKVVFGLTSFQELQDKPGKLEVAEVFPSLAVRAEKSSTEEDVNYQYD